MADCFGFVVQAFNNTVIVSSLGVESIRALFLMDSSSPLATPIT